MTQLARLKENKEGALCGLMDSLSEKVSKDCGMFPPIQVGLPACTWPFCLSTLLFLLLTTNNYNIYKMPLSKVTYSEENRLFYQQTRRRIVESPL